MTPTVPRATPRRKYGREPRVTHYLAPRLGLSPGTVGQLMRGAHRVDLRYAAIADALLVLGDLDRLDRWLAPVRQVLDRVPVEPWSADLVKRTQLMDVAEDAAEADYHAAPTRENRRRFVDGVRKLRHACDVLIRSSEAEDAKEEDA